MSVFVILDTDHFSALVHGTAAGTRLKRRFADHRADAVTTIVTAQEICEGWSAFIRRQKAGGEKQVHGYQQFQHSLALLMELTILPFDAQAAAIFHDLRKRLPQAGTQDLKIAAIALAHDAAVLTRNESHFNKVSGLRVENWLE